MYENGIQEKRGGMKQICSKQRIYIYIYMDGRERERERERETLSETFIHVDYALAVGSKPLIEDVAEFF